MQADASSAARERRGAGAARARAGRARRRDQGARPRSPASGSNRVVFVPGDHDAALLFPAVGRRVVEALGAPSRPRRGRGDRLLAVGRRPDLRRARASDRLQRPTDSSAGRRRSSAQPGGEHLARPWGEQALQDLYNRFEQPIRSSTTSRRRERGVKFALAAEARADAGADMRRGCSATSCSRCRGSSSGWSSTAAKWSRRCGTSRRSRAAGPAFLVAALPDDDRFKPLAAKALADGRLADAMDQLTDDELVAMCDYRAAVRRARRRIERGLTQFHGRARRSPNARGRRRRAAGVRILLAVARRGVLRHLEEIWQAGSGLRASRCWHTAIRTSPTARRRASMRSMAA